MVYSKWAKHGPLRSREQMGCIMLCSSFHITLVPIQELELLSPIVLVSIPVPVTILLSTNSP